MSEKKQITCDRCKAKTTAPGDRWRRAAISGQGVVLRSEDHCPECASAYRSFMAGCTIPPLEVK